MRGGGMARFSYTVADSTRRTDANYSHSEIIVMKSFLLALILLAGIPAVTPAVAASSGYGCYECGTITNIETFRGHRSTTGGMIIGGIAGGLIGNQIGGGSGKTLATVAGAAGGAYAGKKIAEHSGKTMYRVTVRMEDGRVEVVTQKSVYHMGEGSHVIVHHGRARLR
jgi:outer membrane lipoprotein SlyB